MCMSETFTTAHMRSCRDAGLYEPNHHGNKARSASVHMEEISWLQLCSCALRLHRFRVVGFISSTFGTLGGIICFKWDFNILGKEDAEILMLVLLIFNANERCPFFRLLIIRLRLKVVTVTTQLNVWCNGACTLWANLGKDHSHLLWRMRAS